MNMTEEGYVLVEDGFDDVLGTGAIRKKILKKTDGKKAGKSATQEHCVKIDLGINVMVEFGDEVIMSYSSFDLKTDKPIAGETRVAFRIGDNETLAGRRRLCSSFSGM
jgi:hypothetical protein